ncbi:DUF5359 family protein [Cytobacillus oceanisediminis]|uniref:DUF5359 family protein n=1 Tax=Niallia circulans TaxID=1397 RepID=A0A941GEH7_NIACI|nr:MULTISPECIES: DUF5359 family protein [Bacillaceae]MBQ6447347.1 DUF5359 family protein [Bacillus sp. (in: firmicutes)]MDU1844349.1 DUF5359 family protein [Niallia nealsonii]MBZ9533869.1 DUF5359 family protein [Cytobacillus oceanisediminis]MCB5238745.1 YpfB family protein [Niallia circulans]MED3792262.1 DUF5359 family protein [Niallia alba]
MKTVERIIMKIIMFQIVFFMVGQMLHQWDFIPEIRTITQYEGVMDSNFISFLETFGR